MGIKTYQEKNTKPMKKTRAQSGLPVKIKIQKTIWNVTFFLKTYFRVVFWIFLLTGEPDGALIFFIGFVFFSL